MMFVIKFLFGFESNVHLSVFQFPLACEEFWEFFLVLIPLHFKCINRFELFNVLYTIQVLGNWVFFSMVNAVFTLLMTFIWGWPSLYILSSVGWISREFFPKYRFRINVTSTLVLNLEFKVMVTNSVVTLTLACKSSLATYIFSSVTEPKNCYSSFYSFISLLVYCFWKH